PILIRASTAISQTILSTSRPHTSIARKNSLPKLKSGFSEVRVLAVEGPAWSVSQFRDAWSDRVQREKLMEFLSLIETEPSIQGASAHLIVVATSGDRDTLG